MVARITGVVSATGGLKTLSEALVVSGIDETLSEEGPYTLFAPSENAFSEIGDDALVALAADREELAYTLRSHIVSGRYTLSDLVDLERLESIVGSELYVSLGEDDRLYVEEARIIRGDIETDNGVIHIIDLLILPLTDEVVIVDEAAGVASASSVGSIADREADFFFDYEAYADIDIDDDSIAV
jgi:uncharacterized surface protein with fasciclin (FAS1) repeats